MKEKRINSNWRENERHISESTSVRCDRNSTIANTFVGRTDRIKQHKELCYRLCAAPDKVMQPVIPMHSKWKLAFLWHFGHSFGQHGEEEKRVRHVNGWHVLRLNAHTIEKCVWPRVLRTQQFNKLAESKHSRRTCLCLPNVSVFFFFLFIPVRVDTSALAYSVSKFSETVETGQVFRVSCVWCNMSVEYLSERGVPAFVGWSDFEHPHNVGRCITIKPFSRLLLIDAPVPGTCRKLLSNQITQLLSIYMGNCKDIWSNGAGLDVAYRPTLASDIKKGDESTLDFSHINSRTFAFLFIHFGFVLKNNMFLFFGWCGGRPKYARRRRTTGRIFHFFLRRHCRLVEWSGNVTIYN